MRLTMAVPSTLLSILFSLFLLHFPSPSAANEGNIIVSGEVLQTDTQLSVPNAVFVIQNNCNLVLYNNGKGFQSGNRGFGKNCTATLSKYGDLQVKNSSGAIVWQTGIFGPEGEYAAILQPDGQVGIYGPSMWTTRSRFRMDRVEKNIKNEEETNYVPNVLFSSDVLNEDMKLVSRDYAFAVKEGCSLEFTKASAGVLWSSPKKNTAALGHCFARLNFRGQLSLVDDEYNIVWQTKPAYEAGLFALVVKINGEAVIYGPRIWHT